MSIRREKPLKPDYRVTVTIEHREAWDRVTTRGGTWEIEADSKDEMWHTLLSLNGVPEKLTPA